MFSNAKRVAAVTATTKGKAAAKVVETLPGLADVAALEACAKAIKGLIDLKKAALKESATEILIENGLRKYSRPDVLPLVDGDYATGRASVTRRSVVSPLSADELEFLADLVPGTERDEDGNIVAIEGFAETLEKQPAMLAVNPAYAKDEALLKRIDKALSNVKGIPEDFIVQTTAEAKVVVSETAPDAVFRLDAETAAQVFPLIAGVSLGTVFTDVSRAWELVKPLLVPDAKAELGKMLNASLKNGETQ
jgi:hypothetical protein